jgi:glycine oxidase
MRIVVAGAGVVGAVAAWRFAEAGAGVTLADAAPAGNASMVAAGMLAPVFESALDGEAGIARDLLLRGRCAWDALTDVLGFGLAGRGALAVADETTLAAWERDALAADRDVKRLTAAEAESLSPGLRAPAGGLLAERDARLDPGLALARLSVAGEAAGVLRRRTDVVRFEAGGGEFADGERFTADALVVASGASHSLAPWAPELRNLSPIKGHILRAPDFPGAGPVLRLPRVYICPDQAGAIVGASMEAGRDDAAVDAAVVARLLALAAQAVPALAGRRVEARVGVRAATADGLPLVGRSEAPGVWLAAGARRNGWLLAPVIAEALLDGLGGGAGEPALAPTRSA